MTTNNILKKITCFILILLFIVFILIFLFNRNNTQKDICLENITIESTTMDNKISNESSYTQNESYTFYSKEEQQEILNDFYGEWVVVDDIETNKYGAVSKEYTKNDIHSGISISDDCIKIDGCNINKPVIIVEYVDDYYMLTHYKTNMKQFGFLTDKYKFFNIRKSTDEYSDLSFSFITDGVYCYYYYLGTYFKMIKKE